MSRGLSVVIPTHRRPERLAGCLAALAASEYPHGPLEVVVVEDGGPTKELDALRGRTFDSLELVWLDQPHSGPAVARNLGAQRATRDLIAFTDDDCRPRPDWARRLDAALRASPGAVVGGRTVNALAENLWSSASQALVTYITARGQEAGGEPFFASNNFALERDVFCRLEGFDEGFPLAGGEDRDMCRRLVEDGRDLVWVPDAVVDHYHDLSAKRFWQQHFRYGRGAYQYHCAQGLRADPTDQNPSRGVWNMRAKFYLDLVRSPFRYRDAPQRLRIAALLLFSQLPNALGFFAERRRDRESRGDHA
ncbi:MAG: glycosyltransferase [Planctomycetota bacterium]|nr:glycosyltransferase [Planctomycetota bacterium]